MSTDFAVSMVNYNQTKAKISLQEWQQRILECQNSGMSVSAWCRENGISKGAYYFHLRNQTWPARQT
jgi:hypothetical protein